jgi:4-aminobutyrate aminotransferase-like enzyme
MTFVRGEGVYLYDKKDRAYLDLLSGVWCCILGHSHPRFVSELKDQLGKLVHMNVRYKSNEIEQANETLASVLPTNLDRITWLNTGSEAVELAVKIAQMASNEAPIIVWEGGYLGATNYVFSLTHGTHLEEDAVYRIPAPICNQCPLGLSSPECGIVCIDESLKSLDRAAAIIYEPVMGSRGVIVPPSGYNTRVQEYADRLGALLISEEVTTGMGRTGKWFGFQRENMTPDILVLGKALGNGLPVAAVITTSEVEARCKGRLYHYQSHQNDPWSGLVAKTVIETIKQENLVERCERMGKWFLNQLRIITEKYSTAIHTRGLGMMAALQLSNTRYCSELESYLLSRNILIDYRDHCQCLRFFPPYIMEKTQLAQALNEITTWLDILEN